MKLDNKKVHIAIIIIGAIFILLNVFHTNTWFDESYSVAMANHTFSEIWTIGGNDVHPILYYWILHIINLIFGSNILAYRIFSSITIILLGIIGYTHIRKDFGEKTGILFSFLTLFLPVSAVYAGEIRMYTLGMLLGTLMSIYAYRIYKNNITKTTYIIFGMSSLLVAYTHYYGLMLAGIVNLLLFVYLIKNRKNRKQDVKKFIATAIVQIILYIPWLIYFAIQLKNVSSGFWISLTFPGTLIEILNMQYVGTLPANVGLVISIAMYTYIAFIAIKQKNEEKRPAILSILIYVAIILVALLISLCMQSVILLYRYLLIVTGLLIFAIAYFMSKDKSKYRLIAVCTVILAISIVSNIILIKSNYNQANNKHIEYIKEGIKNDDIIIYSNVINGAVVSTYFQNNQSYFYNKDNWNVEEAYKAYSPYMKIENNLDNILKDYSGTIWVIEGDDTPLLMQMQEDEKVKIVDQKKFNTEYKNYNYTIEQIYYNK